MYTKKSIDFTYIIFLIYICLIPATKIQVLPYGVYEFTLGDLLLLIMGLGFALFGEISFKRKHYTLYTLLLLLVVASLPGIVNIKSWYYYLLNIFPLIVSILIFFVLFTVFKKRVEKKYFIVLRNVLVLFLFVSCLPIYYEFITGVKLTYFYDYRAWRYTFLCQNPNQYGVSAILYIYLITLITLKYDNKFRFKLLLLNLYLFLGLFYSGSRSSTLVFTAHFFLYACYYFYKLNWRKKIFTLTCVFPLLVSAWIPLLELIKSKGANLGRALSIFDAIRSDEGPDLASIGDSINDAERLFYENPLIGIGLGNKIPYTGPPEIHNTFMVFLAETGMIGTIAFFLLFYYSPLYALVNLKKSLIFIYTNIVFLLFSAQNYTGMLLRQRWVWFFIGMYFIIMINPKKNIRFDQLQSGK